MPVFLGDLCLWNVIILDLTVLNMGESFQPFKMFFCRKTLVMCVKGGRRSGKIRKFSRAWNYQVNLGKIIGKIFFDFCYLQNKFAKSYKNMI